MNGALETSDFGHAQHVKSDTIRVVQKKTGAQLAMPLHAESRAVLVATPRDRLTFVTTKSGRPFSSETFGNWFRKVCLEAGLEGRSSHGLRKTAATRLAEACKTQHTIHHRHATIREVERYTKAADQERLAREAIARLIAGN